MAKLHVKAPNGTTYAIDLALCKTFIKSGSTAYGGFVPAPSTTAGTTKFLCENATWDTPKPANIGYTTITYAETTDKTTNKYATLDDLDDPGFYYLSTVGNMANCPTTAQAAIIVLKNRGLTQIVIGYAANSHNIWHRNKYSTTWGDWVNFYDAMTGASADAAGTKGLVPAPAKGAQTKFLRGDATWQTITEYTHPNAGANTGSFGPSANASPDYGAGFSVPYITVNAQGHVTAASTKTITLPEAPDPSITLKVYTENL